MIRPAQREHWVQMSVEDHMQTCSQLQAHANKNNNNNAAKRHSPCLRLNALKAFRKLNEQRVVVFVVLFCIHVIRPAQREHWVFLLACACSCEQVW